MKTSDLTDIALDWAVMMCKTSIAEPEVPLWLNGYNNYGLFHYSTDWGHGGPLIEMEGISLDSAQPEDWAAKSKTYQWAYGPTPLIAAMRCYVASKVGDEVEIPAELLGND